jgi:hypothetical protein
MLWITNGIFGQGSSFEGRIIYDFSFTNTETGEDITSDVSHYLGSRQHYYTDGRNYKSYNQDGILTQLYNSGTNKYYFVNPSTQEVMEVDAKEGVSTLENIEHLPEEDMVLGITCRKLKIVTNKDTTTYWYSSTIKVPFENFKDHHYGHWALYLKETKGALPLKYISRSNLYTMTSIVKQIDRIQFEEKAFDIESMLQE